MLACKQSTHCLHESYADISQNFSIIPSEHAALHADAPMHGLLFHECLSSIPLALHGCLHTPLAEPATFTWEGLHQVALRARNLAAGLPRRTPVYFGPYPGAGVIWSACCEVFRWNFAMLCDRGQDFGSKCDSAQYSQRAWAALVKIARPHTSSSGQCNNDGALTAAP